MTSTRSLRLGAFLTLALAASLGLSTTAFAQATKTEAKAKAKAKEAAKDPIDLNSATAEELQTLPGIGEVTARKIIDSRPHKTVADLAAAGVPASTIDKIKTMVDVKPLPKPVDVNTADIAELETLPGVGAVMAKEIVAARPLAGYDDIGKLKGIGPEKLDALKGRVKFGVVAAAKTKAKEAVKTTETAITKAVDNVQAKAVVARDKMEAKVVEAKGKTAEVATKVEEKAKVKVAEAKEKVAEAKVKVEETKEKAAAKIAAGTKVNINTAPLETLDALPGIGPVKAAAILEARREKKFEKIEDIMTVKGIKDGEFAKIKDMITVK